MKVIKKYSGKGGGIQTPTRLIIHAMGEYINGTHASDFLANIGLSAHFLICPDGEIIKTRKTTEIAYHAKGHNRNTVGIEVLVEGDWDYVGFIDRIKENYVKPEQMIALIELSNGIIEHYDMKLEDVERHSDIDPDRKEDPGDGFPWDYFKSELI